MNYVPSDLKVVGTRPIRPDGVDKVTGRAQFGADMVMAGMGNTPFFAPISTAKLLSTSRSSRSRWASAVPANSSAW